MKKRKKRKKKIVGVVIRTVVLVAALAVFFYAAYQLYTIFNSYHKADVEYSDIEASYTSEGTGEVEVALPAEAEAVTDPYLEEIAPVLEDDATPRSVDWDKLLATNPDTVGWIYIEGIPSISYPIVKGDDNDYYLKHTFEGTELFIGSIFMNYTNSADFSDPNTIIYGHRINTGSMFGNLKDLNNQSTYDANPYFWILTPNGNYRYLIYSIWKTPADGEAYTLFSGNGEEFLAWEQRMQANSEVSNDVSLSQYDRTVMLSTCTDDSSVRLVVLGKCVSTQRPPIQAEVQ